MMIRILPSSSHRRFAQCSSYHHHSIVTHNNDHHAMIIPSTICFIVIDIQHGNTFSTIMRDDSLETLQQLISIWTSS
jgi:hypothetical protein